MDIFSFGIVFYNVPALLLIPGTHVFDALETRSTAVARTAQTLEKATMDRNALKVCRTAVKVRKTDDICRSGGGFTPARELPDRQHTVPGMGVVVVEDAGDGGGGGGGGGGSGGSSRRITMRDKVQVMNRQLAIAQDRICKLEDDLDSLKVGREGDRERAARARAAAAEAGRRKMTQRMYQLRADAAVLEEGLEELDGEISAVRVRLFAERLVRLAAGVIEPRVSISPFMNSLSRLPATVGVVSLVSTNEHVVLLSLWYFPPLFGASVWLLYFCLVEHARRINGSCL